MGAVHHRLERFSSRIDLVASFVSRPLDFFTRPVMPLFERFINYTGPLFASVFLSTGLATKVMEPDSHSSETAQALWNEAKRRGIDMYEVRPFGLPRRQFIARYGTKAVAFEGLPRSSRRQKSILWIDDKLQVKKRFQKSGFPVAPGGVASSEEQAIALFRTLKKPVIVKPQKGSGGRHTTVHIETEEELRRAYKNAELVSRSSIVEEELVGPVFRATLIDGKLVAVLRRDPPNVIGDGRSTVRELVAEENKNPLRRGPVFAEIVLDAPYAKSELTRQNLTPDDILQKGKTAHFHFKVNWGVGGISYDVTNEAHLENMKLFQDIGDYLDEDIVGIDFIIEDISKSWRDTNRCGVIECNSLPLIGNHHFPYTGPVVNVAGAIWDMIFPETQTPAKRG